MHIIQFRAKAINRDKGEHRTEYKNGDWVKGLLTKNYRTEFPSLPAEMSNGLVSGIEVDYKTIGQCISTRDKRGNYIFEGDIVKYEGELYKVFYDNGSSRFLADNGKALLGYFSDCVIVGNVFDNPDLLEVINNGN